MCCKENYPNSEIKNISFFNYKSDVQVDCVVMNPPFSLKLNNLTEEERKNIREAFTWKKSGVVDDIFILQSLKFTKRYAFYIEFPGIAYRKSEAKLRELIGNQLVELNFIQNSFDDIKLEVIMMVIDKYKTTPTTFKELYDCKAKKQVYAETANTDDRWVRIDRPVEKEVIDIVELEKTIEELKQRRRINEDKLDEFIRKEVKTCIQNKDIKHSE